MDYFIDHAGLESLTTDCIIVGIYTQQQLTPSATRIDQQTHQLISNLIARADIKGKNSETLLVPVVPDSQIQRILIVGLGDSDKCTAKLYRKALAAAIKVLKDKQLNTIHCTLAEIDLKNVAWDWKVRQLVEVFNDHLYRYSETKSIKPEALTLQRIGISVQDSAIALATRGLTQGLAIAQAIEWTKYIADLPANICTPSYLATQAQQLAEQYTNLQVDIVEEAEMQTLGMGALLSVSRGSRQPAKLICLNYQGTDQQTKPIVLVGKGLTFDAGGISLKPAAGMDEMKYDMCGGATVFGVLKAAADLQLPLNIIGLVPSSENLPDGDANKPGDIVTSLSGKTIEVLNTDAEGRLLLCDTLTYAERFQPEVIIDIATLTGACLVALGRVASGLLGNDDELCEALIAAGETACDSVWRLPLWEEYQEQLKSNFADLANVGGRDGGTITAACFLARFAEDYRWAHLDVAGTAWRTGTQKGATGRPVPLLMQYLLNRSYD